MNYREFTERVYNYKHGLNKSADVQNIQHSAKEENNVLGENNNPEDNIMHSKLGDEWDQHKYIRKEYLGNNNWRYIYADGSSNVTNAANEAQADEAESRSRATQIRSTNKSNYQAEQERKNAGTVGGNTPAPNTVPTPSQQAEEERRRSGTYNPASAIGEHLKANTQSPSNQAFVEGRNAAYQENERKEAGTPSPEVKPNTLLGAELATKARKHEEALKNAKTLTAPDSMKQESAPNFADALKATNANTVSDRQSTPLQQLTNQSIEATSKFDNKTNNPAAYNLLLDYSKGLKEAYDVLASKGYSDEEIDDIINTVEGAFEYPKGMYNQIKNFDNNGYINFMDGAEAGIQDAINDVVPELKNYAETLLTKEQQQARNDMRKFMEPLNVKEVEYLNAAQKAAQNGEMPVKEAPNPYDSYLRNLGYDPADITGADLKKAFPSMYNPNFSDDEHYALQSDQTFAPITRTEEPSSNSSIDPNKWYNSTTGEFVTGTTEADDNEFFSAYRKSFYNTLVNQMKQNPKFTSIYSEKEIEDLARSWTNSNVENMKIAAK